MNKQKLYVNKRKWLNPIDISNSGAISYVVSSWTYDGEEEKYIDGEFSIWDCGRKITLDMSFSSLIGSKNVANKIDKLIESLEDIKCALGKAYNEKIGVLDKDE